MFLDREVVEERVTWYDGLERRENISKGIVHDAWKITDTLGDECGPIVGISPVLVNTMPMLKILGVSLECDVHCL